MASATGRRRLPREPRLSGNPPAGAQEQPSVGATDREASTTPDDAARLEQEAAEQIERNAAALRRHSLPMATEPALIFQA